MIINIYILTCYSSIMKEKMNNFIAFIILLEIDTLVIRVGTLSRGIKLCDVSVIVLVSECVC